MTARRRDLGCGACRALGLWLATLLAVGALGCSKGGRGAVVMAKVTTTSPNEPGASEIPDLWRRLEERLRTLDPALVQHLGPPANDEQIAALEAAVGRTLPATFKASLRVHDGESEGASLGGFYPYIGFLPAERIAPTHTMQKQIGATFRAENEERPDEWRRSVSAGTITIRGNVKPKLFAPDWIPIADSNGDLGLYLDFDPAPGGFAGQVIEVYPEAGTWEVVADSFGELLKHHLGDLESGRVRIGEEHSLEPRSSEPSGTRELPPFLR